MPEILPTDIAPAAPIQPAAAPAAPAEQGLDSLIAQDGEVPEEVLRIPAFNALLEGKPGAIYSPNGEKSPDLATIMKHSPELIKAGFGFYKAESMPVNVMFNALKMDLADLALADSEGRLDEVAAPFSEVKASYDQMISEDQAAAKAAPTAPAVPTSAGPLPAPPAASVQNKMATARAGNLSGGSPDRQGSILASLKRPVV